MHQVSNNLPHINPSKEYGKMRQNQTWKKVWIHPQLFTTQVHYNRTNKMFSCLGKSKCKSTLMVSLTVKYMFSLLMTSIIGFSTFLYLSVHIWHLIKGAGENLMKLKQPDGSLLGNEGIIEDHFCIVVIERTNLKPFKWFIIHWRKSEKM